MKRNIIFILSLYLFSISGLAAQIHYCGGELETISFGFQESTKCCCDGVSKCNNCCKNEEFKPSVSNHFSVKHQTIKPLNLTAIQVVHPELLIKTPIIYIEAVNSLPCKDYNVPDFIRNCVYRL